MTYLSTALAANWGYKRVQRWLVKKPANQSHQQAIATHSTSEAGPARAAATIPSAAAGDQHRLSDDEAAALVESGVRQGLYDQLERAAEGGYPLMAPYVRGGDTHAGYQERLQTTIREQAEGSQRLSWRPVNGGIVPSTELRDLTPEAREQFAAFGLKTMRRVAGEMQPVADLDALEPEAIPLLTYGKSHHRVPVYLAALAIEATAGVGPGSEAHRKAVDVILSRWLSLDRNVYTPMSHLHEDTGQPVWQLIKNEAADTGIWQHLQPPEPQQGLMEWLLSHPGPQPQ